MGKPTRLPTRSDTNRPVQLQNMARNLKFKIKEEEGLYYLCSENKGADQLSSYCTADLRLCFSICRLLDFPCGRSNTCRDEKSKANAQRYEPHCETRGPMVL